MSTNVTNVPEIFGSMVFNDKVMKERLPKQVYKDLTATIKSGKKLTLEVANVVANSMKDWAIEKGVTHFTHWFQPMTGITAEKHDSFISPVADGTVIMEFSGKELIKGEPDASSFPSGGLRATFEARGYTAWDPTSYAFIKEGTLCIPTVFYSYSGEVLDKKAPLLRSMEALNVQALRILKLFGNDDVQKVITTVGPEQEYFLVDQKLYEDRLDLKLTGRTLLGAMPPKGQELDDHYFGSLKPRVAEFMKELNLELWKLGIHSKTEHNEVAPAQHEMAPIFGTTNVATDHNQLTMECLKRVAKKLGLACLLHEKPFKGINGSGKHNNWSLSTDTGKNLLEPGKSPAENAQFLTFLCAVVKAVDKYQDLLRISAASAGNDHRLGANEAPPAIMSMFLGDELTEILESIENSSEYVAKGEKVIELGVSTLPSFPSDTTDRNRTSPFAFTGNKFEFRSLGSTFSVAGPNITLNTIVADALKDFADELEASSDEFTVALNKLIVKTLKDHNRIIFNGNNYSDEWVTEAEGRGLLNLKTTVDALPHFTDKKNIELFERHHVFTEAEMESRLEILLEEYAKTINIESLTMSQMIRKDVLPSCLAFMKDLSETISTKSSIGIGSCAFEKDLLEKVSALSDKLYTSINELDKFTASSSDYEDTLALAKYFKDTIIPTMDTVREHADALELLVGKKYWPFPTYSELLYKDTPQMPYSEYRI